MNMNKDQVKGRVEEAKGKVKEVAGKLTGDETLDNKGKVQKLVGDKEEDPFDMDMQPAADFWAPSWLRETRDFSSAQALPPWIPTVLARLVSACSQRRAVLPARPRWHRPWCRCVWPPQARVHSRDS